MRGVRLSVSDSPTPFSATRRKPNPWVIAGVAVIHVALFYGLIRALAPGAVQSVERSVVSAFTVTVTTPEEPPPPPAPRVPTEAQGYQLHLSSKSSTGYRGVAWLAKRGKFMVFSPLGTREYLGSFSSAEEGAVCYARAAQKLGIPPPPCSPRITPPSVASSQSGGPCDRSKFVESAEAAH